MLAALAVAAALAVPASVPADSRFNVRDTQDATALLECVIQRDGALRACRVTAETPEAMGVGEAALSMADQVRLDPMGDDGRLRTGEVVTLPVRIKIKAKPL